VLKATRDDVFCGSPPLAFTFGLGGLLLFPLRIGATALLLEEASPPRLLEGMAAHRATVCFTAPTAYRAMAAKAGGHDLSALRRCVSAGETLPQATFELWEEATGIRIIDGIGTTEMLHIFISSAVGDVVPGSRGARCRATVRVSGRRGHGVPRDAVGRLAVRGPTGCRYLADEERQRAYVQNGWNMTGDAYVHDEDGRFWYQARTDDMIISAGYNIAGPEVENVLLEHPAVQECGVVGLPDDERGQRRFGVHRAAARSYARARAHRSCCRIIVKQSIAPYKYPRRIEFVDALPRTQTGKLQRFRLREDGE
jgi:2-aminobenzoate-CoA ligase